MKATEVKLTYKRKSSGLLIRHSSDAYDILIDYWDKGSIDYCESFVVVLLSQRNEVLGIFKVSEGGIAGTLVDVRKIYQAAILANASSILIAHNHPSGNLKPSQQDLTLTKRIKAAGEVMQVKLLDHLIVTSDTFYSMMDEGVI